MSRSRELKIQNFFASRAGVCVYVAVGARTFRIQFATPDSLGVVVEGGQEGAEEAGIPVGLNRREAKEEQPRSVVTATSVPCRVSSSAFCPSNRPRSSAAAQQRA
jgi:hypothetical protein